MVPLVHLIRFFPVWFLLYISFRFIHSFLSGMVPLVRLFPVWFLLYVSSWFFPVWLSIRFLHPFFQLWFLHPFFLVWFIHMVPLVRFFPLWFLLYVSSVSSQYGSSIWFFPFHPFHMVLPSMVHPGSFHFFQVLPVMVIHSFLPGMVPPGSIRSSRFIPGSRGYSLIWFFPVWFIHTVHSVFVFGNHQSQYGYLVFGIIISPTNCNHSILWFFIDCIVILFIIMD